jgi:hypothetical protein
MARFSGSSGSGIPANISESELLTLDGVVSAIQTQIDAKLATTTAASTYQAINANVSTTELGYLDGVTSAVQTQLDAKIAKTLTTTTGDTIYASSANTPARLGVGTTGQVLTVAAGVPSWATPASGSSFHGASCYNNSTISYTANTYFQMPFSNEGYDTDGYHDNVTNNSRMTIPAGLAGKYLIIGDMSSQTYNNGTGRLKVKVNGADITTQYGGGQYNGCIAYGQGGAASSNELRGSVVLNLAVGDYVELFAYIDTASSSVVWSAYQISYLGA